jgi:Ca2+-binding RTX toxin-like protein
VHGGDGNDTLDGGVLGDLLWGGDGNDTTTGGDGNDRISGGSGDDTSSGGNGNDRIFANRGADKTDGGEGNDDLWAMARGDVTPGPNGEVDTIGDQLVGGNGNDKFHTRDGEVDTVDCGEGNDTALLDTVDVIVGATNENQNGSCETVQRRAPKAKDKRQGKSHDHDKGHKRDNR